MIRYLVKFVAKEEYADDLLDGKLFMHCAEYYRVLEQKIGKGQGDLREGMVLPGISLNTGYYIYCMYTICDEDIIDNCVIINQKNIRDFSYESGYMVIAPFTEFQKALYDCDTYGYAMDGQEVVYGKPSKESIDKIFKSEKAINLLIKHPDFAYQKEYRLIVYKKNDNVQSGYSDCDEMMVCCTHTPLSDIAKKIPISSIKTDAGYLLDLSKVFP